MSLSVEAATAASVNDYVAGFVDGDERGRLFINEAGTPANGITNSLPQVLSISRVTQADDSFGGSSSDVGGGFKLVLKVSSVDTENASSVMSYFLDSSAYIIKASTSNG